MCEGVERNENIKRIIRPVFIRTFAVDAKFCPISLDPEHIIGGLMQDDARPHRIADVFSFLKDTFQNHIIALDIGKFIGQEVEWPPPYCPELTPCDFFHVGLFKGPSLSDWL